MKYSHLLILMKEADFSPEQLGLRLGVSGMTLRRWAELSPDMDIPRLYAGAIQETVYELAAEGVLDQESVVLQLVLKENEGTVYFAAMKSLGIGTDLVRKADHSSDSVVQSLMQIGEAESKQQSVDRSKKKILSYQKLGEEWKVRLETLLRAIGSAKLKNFEKFAAYGALFYLIMPFDLIPDNIPIFGLVDDFAVLGFAVNYYLKRFPEVADK